ncbi:MAG: site-specific DNA-methyltransferase [Phycisphaerae bacterium]|nr:site-specific DNA-methyltransferase [Phycisphaerae bacterium]
MRYRNVTPDTIYCGDSIRLLGEWESGCVDLVFADPPFNIGYVYDRYKDDLPDAEYVEWTRDWMSACQRVLKPTGSFYIAIGDEFAADIRIIGRELGMHLRNWIIWRYTFGQNMRVKFCRSHTHIFYFSMHAKEFTFNDHLLRFPSARHTEYQDLRANPQGRLPDDVWDEFPRVCGTFKERTGFHGCQMPEALLMRIVMASSDPGEIVLDPFIGSGTTAVAAKRAGRRYIGIDLSDEYATHTRKRLEQVELADKAGESDGWPALHIDMLAQLYRETKVTLANLLPNEVALRVVTASLSARAGHEYSVEEVAAQFERMAARLQIPKLPNDVPFVARSHVKSEGKRYVRRVTRYRGRRDTDPQEREAV